MYLESMAKKKDHDFADTAFRIVQEVINPKPLDPEPELVRGKNPYAVNHGRRGGLKGGMARAEKLTPEQRTEIAKNAAAKRGEKKTP
jgi:hypothetical protein